MGNTISSSNLNPINISLKTEKQDNSLDLIDTLDFIACNYIFTMNYENMKKLYDKSYCDKLVVLTSEIINNYYSELEVQQLSDRIRFGEDFLTKPKNEKIFYYTKGELPENKQSNCNQIAKFYIKIGHLFSAILTTISPEYVYKDPKTGQIIKKTLQQKNEIPFGVYPEVVSNNLCNQRLQILMNKQNSTIQKDNLFEENGIPELMNLYLDSNYDFSTGLFTSMSKENKQKYNKDLNDFYISFTQEEFVPDYIKSFSDIKLIHKENIFDKYDINEHTINTLSNQSLLQKYAENIRNMIQRIHSIQQKFLSILNQVFVIVDNNTNHNMNFFIELKDDLSTNHSVRISHLLTEDKLHTLIEECRENIVDLYIHCEEDFIEGINIYEAIIEDILFKTTKNQITSLQDILEKIYTTKQY
jgi:hypothetical protein